MCQRSVGLSSLCLTQYLFSLLAPNESSPVSTCSSIPTLALCINRLSTITIAKSSRPRNTCVPSMLSFSSPQGEALYYSLNSKRIKCSRWRGIIANGMRARSS